MVKEMAPLNKTGIVRQKRLKQLLADNGLEEIFKQSLAEHGFKKPDLNTSFYNAKDINVLLDLIEHATKQTTTTQINTTKNTTIIEQQELTKVEQRILDALDEPRRFKDIGAAVGMGDGNVFNYLRTLIKKGLVGKTTFSKKKVVYHRL